MPRCCTPLPDELRLQHIVQYASEALQFIDGRTRSDLDGDRMLAYSLVRCLEVIGEAASQVSEETRARFPEIPWRRAVGMRHRLIHSYFEVDNDRVWKTASMELRPLVQAIVDSGAMEWSERNSAPEE